MFFHLQGGGQEGDGIFSEQYKYVFSIMNSFVIPNIFLDPILADRFCQRDELILVSPYKVSASYPLPTLLNFLLTPSPFVR